MLLLPALGLAAWQPGAFQCRTLRQDTSVHHVHHGTLRQSLSVRMAEDSDNAELAKLQSTLEGLSADGFPPEALAPLRSQITSLEEKIALAKLRETLEGLSQDGLPPEALAPLREQIASLEEKVANSADSLDLSSEQQKIWDFCDKIDAAAAALAKDAADDFAKQRLSTLKAERRFLLNALLRSDAAAYTQLLSALSTRSDSEPIADADFPSISGMAMSSAAAVEEGLASEAAATAAAETRAEAVKAAGEAAAAAAELENEAAAGAAAIVDVQFARCFLTSEERRCGLPHRYVGADMWSERQVRVTQRAAPPLQKLHLRLLSLIWTHLPCVPCVCATGCGT